MSKSLTTTFKVTATIAVAIALVFGAYAVTATTAQAVTLSELVELFISLGIIPADKADAARAALASSGGSQQTGGLNCATFTRNHSQGDSGGEVMAIQKFLNSVDGTQLASTGAGSPGNETSYFGSITKAAVVQFQNKFAADVLAPVGLTAGTGYWGPSSRAKANALCAGGGGGTTTPPPATGTGVTVSAAAQPANTLAPYNAARVPFTKFTLTNNSSSAVTINGVVVERTGLAADTNFDGVVLLDGSGVQLGNSQLLNANHQATVGGSFTLQPGTSMTYTVAGNMADSTTVSAGQVASFAVVGINTTATLTGSLPITGASHTINATLALGVPTATYVTVPGADASKPVGTTGYTFSTIRLTAGSQENMRVTSMRWNQSGSASASDLSNMVVVVDGTEYPATVSSDGKYYTAVFGAGIVVNKGLNKEFAVKGNIVGGAGRTVAFDIYQATDIYMVGETFGYGLTIEDGNTTDSSAEGTWDDDGTPAFDGFDVTIQAGTVNSLSKSNTVTTGNVAVSVPSTPLGAFEINLTGEPIQINTMKFAIDLGGTIVASEDGDDITNVTLVDQNGNVLAGPVNGSATDYTPTGGTASEGSVSFTSVTIPVGVTTLTLKGQIGSDLDGDDTVTIRVNPADWTGVKGQTTGNTISLTSAESSANTQTIKAASLAAFTQTQPAAQSVVKGAVDFIWAQGLLDAANSGEDIRVTTISVKDTTTATATAADIDNLEIWANLTGGSTADSPTRSNGTTDVFETLVAFGDNFSDTDAGDDETEAVTLDTPVLVARNTSVAFAVIGDLSSNATGDAGTDTHTVDIDAVTASGVTTGTAANVASGSVTGDGQAMTVQTSGTLTISVDSSSPSAKLLLDNSTEQTTAVFRLAANNVENLGVDSIKVTSDGADDAVAKYVLYHGTTKLGEVNGGQDTAELFLTSGQLTVPKNSHVLVTVKVVMNDIDGTQVANADTVITTIAAAGDVDTTGKDSGQSVDSTQTSVDAATHVVYEAYPTFAFDNSGVTTVLSTSANYLVGKLTVTNLGDKDISFDDTATANNLEIQFSGNDGGAALNETVTIKDQDGLTLDSGAISSDAVAFDFSTNSLTIPAFGTKTIYIYVDASGLATDGDTIQAWLDDGTAGDLGFSIGSGTSNYSEADYVFKGDLFGPVHVNPS